MPRPIRHKFITERIRALEPGEWIVIANGAEGSVKSIVSRWRQFSKKRKYRTFKSMEGIVVECMK